MNMRQLKAMKLTSSLVSVFANKVKESAKYEQEASLIIFIDNLKHQTGDIRQETPDRRHQDIKTSGHQDIKTSGHLDIKTSGHLEMRTSRHQTTVYHHIFCLILHKTRNNV